MPPDLHPTPAQRAARRVGSTLLKWRLDRLLGVGATAAVYAATHHNRSRVALKILHRELAASQELRARFLREGYVANSVGHEGAVQVLDDQLSEEGEPVLVMQLLEGQALDALQAARGVLPVDEALGYADQILGILGAAHARGIIHRDIKPQNVFVTTQGAVKLLDFGVARLFDGTASMTATGSLVGTPAFMPPEQAGGRVSEVGPASDLWSVGATVLTLLTGRFVHEAPNVQQHTVKAAVQPARSIATLRPDLPAPLVQWVDKALSFDVAGRFRTAAEMREALGRVRAAIAAPRVSVPAPPAAGEPLSTSRRTPEPGPIALHEPSQYAPDPAAIARAHGLPPPAPKRELTRAEKGGIAGVAVLFVVVVGLVVQGLARSSGAGGASSGAAAGSKPSGTADLAVWLGSSARDEPSAAPGTADPAPAGTQAEPAAAARGFVAEEGRAALDAGEAEARRCSKKLGPKGRVSVQVTFYPDGTTTAQVEIAFGRTPVGICVEEAFRSKARVKPFEGPAVTVTRMVHVP